MSYWWPPDPTGFDPTSRPLSWHWETIDGKQVKFPDPVDAEIFGIDPNPANINQPAASDSNNWVGVAPTDTLHYGGQAFNKPYSQSKLIKSGVTQKDRLAIYNWLISQATPEDPASGGLGPDWYDPRNGEIVRQYWDFSDDRPKRKAVHYLPKVKDVSMRVYQWNADQQKWEDEGWDIGRDIINNLPGLIQAFGAVTTVFVGFVSGIPALAAAWSQVAQISSQAALGGPPPSLLDFARTAGAYLTAAPGFGAAMADQVKSMQFKQSLFGQIGTLASSEIAQYGREVTNYIQKLQKVARDNLASIPKLDLAAAAKGIIPPDVQTAVVRTQQGLASFDLISYKKAVDAYLSGANLDQILALRKSAPDKDTFDATYASAMAASGPGIHAPRYITGPTAVQKPIGYGTAIPPTQAAPKSSALGVGLTAAGVAGLAGVSFLRFAPNAWQRKVRAPSLTEKQLWIGAGVAGSLTLIGLILKARASKPAPAPEPGKALATTAVDSGATGTVSSMLRR